MSNLERRKAEELFQQIADLPAEQRAALLDQQCGDQPHVRAEVESLLVHFDSETVASLQTATVMLSEEARMTSARIGPYKLLQIIGEGGFGSVYMAEQEQPVRRRVALKIIKLGMDTRQVIARFEAERQALAMMEHPNIARVLDAGATDTGRPYFVMELVRGIAITGYCDQNSLSTEQRLELFLQVCRAVQHAHQKGVIHRDIKPSNVLVTLHDGTPVPKVIDFGIAKATSQRLTEKTLFTEFLQFMGTPQYMSPEQAEMSGLDVDTRTDIYSLGVLLYELLTSTTPFDGETLRNATYTEIQRIIREEDPPTPSRRLSTLGERLVPVASSRRAQPQTLSKLLRGDLDWIVMRALEKDRTRRYETAAALAADIQHHLDHEPVAAGPPGAGYRMRKFVRRHQVGVVAGSLVTAALLVGLALSAAGFIQARVERDRARAAEKYAQLEAENARIEAESAKAINAFFNDMLTSVDPMQVRQLSAFAPDEAVTSFSAGGFARNVSVVEMVRQAALELDEAFIGKPELEAASRETIGMILRGLGLFAEAEPQLRGAYEIHRRRLGDDHPDTLQTALALGAVALDAGKAMEARPLVSSAFEGMKRVHGPEHAKTLSCASILAQVYSDLGEYKSSEGLFRKTLDAQRRTLGPEHRDALSTMWNWSASLFSQGKRTEGEALARELHDVAAKTLDPDDSLNILSKPLMGWWYLAQFRYDEAEAVLRTGLEHCSRILGAEHPFTYTTMHALARSLQGAQWQEKKEQLHQQALAGLRATRGRLHWHTISTTADYAKWLDHRGRFAEAEQLYRALVTDCARSLGEEHFYTRRAMASLAAFLERAGKLDEAVAVRRDLLVVTERCCSESGATFQAEMGMTARALVNVGRIDEARAVNGKRLAYLCQRAEAEKENYTLLNNYAWGLLTCVPTDMRDVAAALPIAEKAVKVSEWKSPPLLDTLALAYDYAGRIDEAIKTQRRSLELLSPEERYNLVYPAALFRYLMKKGDTAAATKVIVDAVETFREVVGEDNPILALEFNKAGMELADYGNFPLAEALLREAVELNRNNFGAEHEQVGNSLKNLGDVYHKQGKYDLAESNYRAALAIRRKLLGDNDVSVADTRYRLGAALHHGGKPSAAAVTMREVLEVYKTLNVLDIPVALGARCHLAQVLVELGELDEAEVIAGKVLDKTQALYGDHHLRTAQALGTMGQLLTERGEAAQAEPLLRKSCAIHRRLEPSDEKTWLIAQADGTLGDCLTALRRFDEAGSLLLESYKTIQSARGDPYFGTRTALDRIIALYEAWDKPDQADQWRTKSANARTLAGQNTAPPPPVR